MAVRTKPVRLFETDEAILGLLSGALRRNRSEVVHTALAEYLRNHSGELSDLFATTQQALAAGDIDALVRAASPALEREVDSIMADLPQ